MSTLTFRSGRTARLLAAAFCAVFAIVSATSAGAQESKSALAAKELGDTLDRLKLDSIAAADPADPGMFVAALYFPGAQLLVVSAKYSAPTLLNDKLTKKEFRDVYIDLSSASIAATKVFIMDQAANGLVYKPGDEQPADSWEHGTKSTSFDGDWKKAKLSEEEYLKTFTAADVRYAQILALLSAQAKKSGS